jgi:hypothetical protein
MFLILAILVAAPAMAPADIIINQDFDGGYTGGFGQGSYTFGGTVENPITFTKGVVSGVGNPNNAFQESMTPTDWGQGGAGQLQFGNVSGNTDPNPANYTLSFDAKGSRAAPFVFIVQSMSGTWFSGSTIIDTNISETLSAADTWQTFSVNLGTMTAGAIPGTSGNPTGKTWQLGYQMNAWEWGGPNLTNTLTIDNFKLTVVPEPSTVTLLAVMGLVAALWFRRK